MKISSACILTAVLAATTPALAQDTGFAAEIGISELGNQIGTELGIGAHITSGQFRLTPLLGVFIYQGELEGFDLESDSICRDLSNGEFSDLDNCEATEVLGYGKLEASLLFAGFELGAGYRVASEDNVLYGLASAKVGERGGLKISVGEDYLALSATFNQ